MRPVVADTGPLNYLILIEAVDVLPRLFSPVSIPPGVRDELSHPKAPTPVRSWMSHPPTWLSVVSRPNRLWNQNALEFVQVEKRRSVCLNRHVIETRMVLLLLKEGDQS
jgi:predicted nucleic acid-binding protein